MSSKVQEKSLSREALSDVAVSSTNQSKPRDSKEIKPTKTKLALTTTAISSSHSSTSSNPDKHNISSSSSLLDYHRDTLKNGKNLEIEAVNKRLSEISQDSKCDSPDVNQSPRDIKKLIGPWQLGCTLGEGATGRVRKARHTGTGQVAAVKIMSKTEAAQMRSTSVMVMDTKLADSKITRNKLPFGLEREIVIMKVINHPNITKLYDIWENRGEIYLVLEYVDGGELFKHIVDNGCLAEAEAFRIFRQLLSAIAFCHMFRLCHRDIKPENILLDKDGNVKLADFGMASREHIGGLETACGSPHYAPPEIACGEPYVGSQVDIWSCGVVLYVMIVGALPFGSHLLPNDIEGVLTEIANEEPSFSEKLSRLAADLVIRMLDKDATRRINAEGIWKHPVMVHDQMIAECSSDKHRWIGGPPAPLTTNDCGPKMERKDIDNGLLAGLCVMWHVVKEEEMVEKLIEEKPNYEKVVYRNLLLFREEQLNNYYSNSLEYADSDVHHIHRPIVHTKTRADLLGPKPRARPNSSPPQQLSLSKTISSRALLAKSLMEMGPASRASKLGARRAKDSDDPYKSSQPPSSAKYTIAAPPPSPSRSQYCFTAQPVRSARSQITSVSTQASRNTSQRSQGTDRSKSTNKSYDPFRASSTGVASPKPDHARVTVLGGEPSYSSRYAYVSYAAAQRRPPSDRAQSEASGSVRSAHSCARDHFGNARQLRRTVHTRQKSSSSWTSTNMATSSVRSFSVSSMKNKRGIVMPVKKKSPPPPPRGRKIQKPTEQENYGKDVPSAESNCLSPVSLVAVQELARAGSPQKRKPKGFSLSPPDRNKRTSILWEERTREASQELSALMDEVFSDSKLEEELWDDDTKKAKEEEFVRKSFDLPRLRETGYSRSLPDVALKKPEAPPPAPNPVNMRSLYDADTVEELQKVRLLLENRARDLETEALNPVIDHLTRLLDADPGNNTRRVISAPEPGRYTGPYGSLSPVKEEEEPRSVSSPLPTRTKHGLDTKSTIRLVEAEDSILMPAPLKIKKKTSLAILKSPRGKKEEDQVSASEPSKGRLRFGSSSLTLDKLLKRDPKKSGTFETVSVGSMAPSPLFDAQGRCFSGNSSNSPRNWFRRSRGSTISSASGRSDVESKRGAGNNQNGSKSDTTGSEFPFRMPEKESAVSKIARFFKGKPKEKRMQIVVPGEDDDDYWYDIPNSNNLYGHRYRERIESTSTVDQRNSSNFAALRSPHLYNTAATRDYSFPAESQAPTNFFSKFFGIPMRQLPPQPQIVTLQLSLHGAIHEIRSILRDWRRYGLTNIKVNRKERTIRATVSEDNSLAMQPVALCAMVLPVAVYGKAGGLSIVRIEFVWGNHVSFEKASKALSNVLSGRGLVVKEKHVRNEMKAALREWEKMVE